MKLTVGIALLVALTGCSQEEAVKDAVKSRLRDPGSAQFQQVLVSKKGDTACVIVNAKNGFGGYGEWKGVKLKKVASTWELDGGGIAPESCTEQAINAWDRYDEATRRLREKQDELCSSTSPGLAESRKVVCGATSPANPPAKAANGTEALARLCASTSGMSEDFRKSACQGR